MSDLISRQAAIDALADYIHNVDRVISTGHLSADDCKDAAISVLADLPSAQPKTDEENELKFYYVESIDDYWIGQRLDNFYYADWHDGLGFVWSKSRYLPWGEHVVNEQTLWKEHTYPSEPKEIPFTMWIVGFLEKHSADRPRGEWLARDCVFGVVYCSECGYELKQNDTHFCPNCGADMRGEQDG